MPASLPCPECDSQDTCLEPLMFAGLDKKLLGKLLTTNAKIRQGGQYKLCCRKCGYTGIICIR